MSSLFVVKPIVFRAEIGLSPPYGDRRVGSVRFKPIAVRRAASNGRLLGGCLVEEGAEAGKPSASAAGVGTCSNLFTRGRAVRGRAGVKAGPA